MSIIDIYPYKRQYYTYMKEITFKSLPELQTLLGEQIQQLRISKNLGQIATAEKAGVSEKALRNLEAGRGSTVESLLRVLKALDSLDGLQLIVPRPSVSPLAMLRHARPRRRVRRRASGTDKRQSDELPAGDRAAETQRGI
jgi:transcriptional regulator with XRE-family HTH domain